MKMNSFLISLPSVCLIVVISHLISAPVVSVAINDTETEETSSKLQVNSQLSAKSCAFGNSTLCSHKKKHIKVRRKVKKRTSDYGTHFAIGNYQPPFPIRVNPDTSQLEFTAEENFQGNQESVQNTGEQFSAATVPEVMGYANNSQATQFPSGEISLESQNPAGNNFHHLNQQSNINSLQQQQQQQLFTTAIQQPIQLPIVSPPQLMQHSQNFHQSSSAVSSQNDPVASIQRGHFLQPSASENTNNFNYAQWSQPSPVTAGGGEGDEILLQKTFEINTEENSASENFPATAFEQFHRSSESFPSGPEGFSSASTGSYPVNSASFETQPGNSLLANNQILQNFQGAQFVSNPSSFNVQPVDIPPLHNLPDSASSSNPPNFIPVLNYNQAIGQHGTLQNPPLEFQPSLQNLDPQTVSLYQQLAEAAGQPLGQPTNSAPMNPAIPYQRPQAQSYLMLAGDPNNAHPQQNLPRADNYDYYDRPVEFGPHYHHPDDHEVHISSLIPHQIKHHIKHHLNHQLTDKKIDNIATIAAKVAWTVVSSYIFVFVLNAAISLIGKFLGLSDSYLETKITLGKDAEHPFSHYSKSYPTKGSKKGTYKLANGFYHPATALYDHPTYQYYPGSKDYTLSGFDQHEAVKYAKKYSKKYAKKAHKYGLRPKPILPYIPAYNYGHQAIPYPGRDDASTSEEDAKKLKGDDGGISKRLGILPASQETGSKSSENSGAESEEDASVPVTTTSNNAEEHEDQIPTTTELWHAEDEELVTTIIPN